jgi:hypothetical protein
MKFKEYLKENEARREKVLNVLKSMSEERTFGVGKAAWNFGTAETVYYNFDDYVEVREDGKIVIKSNGESRLAVFINGFSMRYEALKLSADDWILDDNTVQFSFDTSLGLQESMIPNVPKLVFIGCHISSFNLSKQDFSKVEELDFFSHTNITCGLLSLLKLPKLKTMMISNMGGPVRQALEIVYKHIEHKNIPECMDELIDAGLKDFAKL